jgi:hypothetical protein
MAIAAAEEPNPSAPPDEATSYFADARVDAPLGTLLFRAGLVPDDDLRDALEHAVENKRRLGEVLVERALVSERDLARILASQKGLAFVEAADLVPDPRAVGLLPEERAREWGALVVAFEGERAVVAVSDPGNRYVFGRLSEVLGRKPRFVASVPGELAQVIDTAYAELRVVEPEQRAAKDEPASEAPEANRASWPEGSRAQVIVVLTNGERIEACPPMSRVEALEEAQTIIRGIDERTTGAWPLAGGRFVRPEAVVSVDVVDVPSI